MFLEPAAIMQGSLDTALGSMLGSGPAKSSELGSLLEQQSGGHLGFRAFRPSVFGPGLPGELGVESSDDLITPATVEVQAGSGQLPSAPAAAAAAMPPVPRQHQCLLCGGLGSQGACGPLKTATVEGEAVAVHHLCAIWSPGCYLPEVGAPAVPTTRRC